jgi:putative flippase GtrA
LEAGRMADVQTVRREGMLGAKYACVSLAGFTVDAILLHLLIAEGLEAAWSRVVSLIVAMQVTFLINGLFVFKKLTRRRLPRQWAGYMVTNGFGNFWNYWIFVTLVSTHWPVIAAPMVALCVGAFSAWVMNYLSARFLVFRRAAGVVRAAKRSFGPRRAP